jgi:aarF domain-containing kinase
MMVVVVAMLLIQIITVTSFGISISHFPFRRTYQPPNSKHGMEHGWTPKIPSLLHAFSTGQDQDKRRSSRGDRGSSSSSSTSSNTGQPRASTTIRRSVLDRTPEEAQALLRDIVQTLISAGPRTGPTRTLQAINAILTTSNEFVLQTLNGNNRVANTADQSSSSSATLNNSNNIQEQIPKYLRLFFERMGATYIKLGQFIASSPSLFPATYVKEFQKCLDSTTPIPWSIIQQVIETELNGPISKTFAYINETPLASASIAQVHIAKLLTGEDVVIKVQKPGIDTVLQADLGFLFITARILEYIQPDWERTSLSAVTSDIRSSMLEELDFTLEARNTIEFRRFLQENGLLNVATAPLVYLQHSTKRILVMERLNGVSMLDENMLAMTKDPTVGTDAILTALNIWTLSIQKMPWFHADVHAGNLMLLNDGRVGFIDFGIVGRISPQIFTAVMELSTALADNDSIGMARALCNMGATERDVNISQFAQDIDTVLGRIYNVVPTDVTILTDGQQIFGASATLNINDNDITDLLLELVQMTEQNGLKLPREFGLLVKQSLYFDRYLKILAPDVNVMNDVRVRGITDGTSSSSKDRNDKKRVVIDV